MKRSQILAGIAMTVAAVSAWAETPVPEPATPPPDPLAGYIKPAEWLQKQGRPKCKEPLAYCWR